MEWYEKSNEWFDCFEVLELDENASLEDIKHAYRKLAKKYHPDQVTGDKEKYERVNIAYKTLKDEVKREKYIAFSKSYNKGHEESSENDKQEESMNFTDIVKGYKEKEKQIRIAINVMIREVETKEQKFSALYHDFCNALKNKNMNESDFEVRRQKLRSLELSNINSLLEIREIIANDLKHVDLDYEKKRLKEILFKFKEKESILTSNYRQAIIKLNMPSIRFKKQYAALIPISIILAGLYLFNSSKEKPNKEAIAVGELVNVQVNDFVAKIINLESVSKLENERQADCILFQEIPEDMEYDEISDSYMIGSYDVVSARKNGVGYILDANDHHVIISNYFSHGGSFYENGERVVVFLGMDGYDYTLALPDLRTVLEIEPAYSEKSEPFYLDGYGNVIEYTMNNKKYLVDAETQYPVFKCVDDYSEMYYDEEFGCNVYCYTKYDERYYVQADDVTKVLKIDNLK